MDYQPVTDRFPIFVLNLKIEGIRDGILNITYLYFIIISFFQLSHFGPNINNQPRCEFWFDSRHPNPTPGMTHCMTHPNPN